MGRWAVHSAHLRHPGGPATREVRLSQGQLCEKGLPRVRNPANTAPRCIDTPGTRNQNTRLVFAEGYPSGQREQTVNLPAYAFVGSNPTPSTTHRPGSART